MISQSNYRSQLNIKKLSVHSSNSENYFYTCLREHGAPGQSWAAKLDTLQCLTVKEAQATGLHTLPLDFKGRMVRLVRIYHMYSHVTLCTCSFPFRFLRFLVFLSSWKQLVKSASLHFASHFVRSLRYHGFCLRFSQVLLYIRALLSGLSLMGRWIHWSFDGLVSAASLLLQQDPSPVRTSRRWIFHHRHLARIQHFSLKTLPLVRTKGLEVIWMIWTRKSFHAMPSGCLHSVTFHLHFLVTSPSHSVNSTPSAYLSRFEVPTSTSVSCVIQTNQLEFGISDTG